MNKDYLEDDDSAYALVEDNGTTKTFLVLKLQDLAQVPTDALGNTCYVCEQGKTFILTLDHLGNKCWVIE